MKDQRTTAGCVGSKHHSFVGPSLKYFGQWLWLSIYPPSPPTCFSVRSSENLFVCVCVWFIYVHIYIHIYRYTHIYIHYVCLMKLIYENIALVFVFKELQFKFSLKLQFKVTRSHLLYCFLDNIFLKGKWQCVLCAWD